MRLLVLALCAGLAAAIPTPYDVAENEVGTSSKVFQQSKQQASYSVEETSYFYSTEGESIIEITVAEAPAYNLVCMPSKELVESAQVIVQETIDEEEEAATAASGAGTGAATSAAAGTGAAASAAAGESAAASAAAAESAAASAAAAESAAAAAAAAEGAAASAAAGQSAAVSAAAAESAAASAAAVESAAASAAAAESAAASAAAAQDSAASAAAGGAAAASAALSESAAAAAAAAAESAAASAAAGQSAAAAAAAAESAAASAAAAEGSAASAAAGGAAAASAAATESAAASAAAGQSAAAAASAAESAAAAAAAAESAAASAAAGQGAAASAAAAESAAASAAAGQSAAAAAAAAESAAAAAAAAESAAASAAAGAGATATAAIGAGATTTAAAGSKIETSAAIYVQELIGPDDLDKCICVPFYLCKEENIISDGAGEIDIRFGAGAGPTNTKCKHFESVCCLHPESRPVPEIVAELIDPYYPSCGHRNPHGIGFAIEGFKDSEAQFAEFPHMAIIMEEEYVGGELRHRYVCGGSLISKNIILTAGHCVAGKDSSKLLVRLGDWNTKTFTELLPHQEFRVTRSVVHEKLNKRTLFNTVALLFLESEVELQPHIDTICLPSIADVSSGVPFYDAAHCVATGFGRDQFQGGQYQNIMKQVDLAEVPHDDCQDKLRRTRLGRWFRLHRSFTCAGGKPGVDTCRGDGGSPLICPLLSNPDKYVQVGIVAWGIGCGEGGVPGVYASVSQLLPWILEHMSDVGGTATEQLVEQQEAVQVCITKNPFTEAEYQEQIPIRVGVPPPVQQQYVEQEHFEQQQAGY